MTSSLFTRAVQLLNHNVQISSSLLLLFPFIFVQYFFKNKGNIDLFQSITNKTTTMTFNQTKFHSIRICFLHFLIRDHTKWFEIGAQWNKKKKILFWWYKDEGYADTLACITHSTRRFV
jgi:hypothetical protein